MTKPAFPQSAFAAFKISDDASARELLRAIEHWRRDTAGWLASGGPGSAITPTLSALLANIVAGRPAGASSASPYHVGPYPEHALAPGNALSALHAVLVWRAGIVDFLADVWDTLLDPPFHMQECGEASALFFPQGGARGLCALCLEPVSSDPAERGSHFVRCPAQLAWQLESGPAA